MEFCIRLQGHLDPSWQAWFVGLQVEHEATGTTLLTGDLPDQAALFGVLLKIQRLGVPLLGINSRGSPPIMLKADRNNADQEEWTDDERHPSGLSTG